MQRKITKRGDTWAIVTVEDLEGAIEVLLFPSAYQLASTMLLEDTIVVVKGRLNRGQGPARGPRAARSRQPSPERPPPARS